MSTTHATAVSRLLCTSHLRPANNSGLPCLIYYLCCSIQARSAVHLTPAGVRLKSCPCNQHVFALPAPARFCPSRSSCSVRVSTPLCTPVLRNAHIKTGLHSPGQLVACWVQTWRCLLPPAHRCSTLLVKGPGQPTCNSVVLVILISLASPCPLSAAPIPSLMLGRSWGCSLRRPTCGTSCLPCTPPRRHLQQGRH